MPFWKPGEVAPPGVEVERETEQEGGGSVLPFNPNERFSLAQQRTLLPIYQYRRHILYLVENYQTVVIVGQTGCGKSTQIPQYLHEAGWSDGGRVVTCTQPRRVATTTLAERVAEEQGVTLGEEVGYLVRFDDCTHEERTRIKYLTDGMLLRECLADPLLSSYSVIMLDEAHERSLHTDVILGLLKKIQRKRPELRLIISSATVDARHFYEYFNSRSASATVTLDSASPSSSASSSSTALSQQDTAALLSIQGRSFPVDVHYLREPTSDYVRQSVETVLTIHRSQPEGDILVFLTGQAEIDHCCELLRSEATEVRGRNGLTLVVCPLYAGLPADRQTRAFESAAPLQRKVVVSTNIAEASVTLPGVVYVVDCGFVKERVYRARSGTDALLVVPTSKASAIQRAGRAGRVQPGKCYRLYTEQAFSALLDQPVPEMQRCNLTTMLLQLKALGIDDVLHFPFLSPPPPETMIRGLELLYALGALDDDCRLTSPLGTTMAESPLDPCLTKMLLAAGATGCAEEVLSIAAVLSVQTVFQYPKEARGSADLVRRRFAVAEGDHLTLLNVFNAFQKQPQNKVRSWCSSNYMNYGALRRAMEIRAQLKRYLRRCHIPIHSSNGDTIAIRKAIVSGYFANAAQMQPDGSYRTVRDGHILHIHPASILFNHPPEFLCFHEVVFTTKEYMRDVVEIEPLWLAELAPHFFEYRKRIPRNVHTDSAASLLMSRVLDSAGPGSSVSPSSSSSSSSSASSLSAITKKTTKKRKRKEPNLSVLSFM